MMLLGVARPRRGGGDSHAYISFEKQKKSGERD
jgi:hypothetical protein